MGQVSVAQELENTLLWKISGNGLTDNSYLYGTMHVGDDRAYQFGDSVAVLFGSCDAVALEIVDDMFLGDASAFDPSMMDMVMMENGDLLENYVSKKEFRKIKKLFSESMENMMPTMPGQEEEAGGNSFLMKMMAGFLVNRIKPMFTSTLISMRDVENDHPLALDAFLMEQGQELEKEMIGIETIEEQMDAFNRIPIAEQAQILVDQTNNMDAAKKEMEKMLNAYANQNLNELMDLTSGYSEGEDAKFEEELLIKRNYIMAERVDTIIQKRSTFVAVGAGHLPGESGLINQLRVQGYTVEPVMSSGVLTKASFEDLTPKVKTNDNNGKASVPAFEELCDWMTGSFNSTKQAEEDTDYDNISLEMHPIWEEREDAYWLYVEQALATAKDKPLSQRIYKVVPADNENGFVSYIYTLPEPEKFVGKWDDVALFKTISPEILEERTGCEVMLQQAGDAYAGATGESSCESNLRGASYETSKVTVTQVGIISWDRGFDKDGKQVWGAEKGGYIFEKMD